MASSSGDVPFVYTAEAMCQGRQPWDSSFIERASLQCPNNSMLPLILGLYFAEQGQYPEAVEQIEEAERRAVQYCERFPDSPVPKKELEAIRNDLRDARELVRRNLPS